MPVRKPKSVKEKPIKSFDEITPDFLAEKERHWEEVRLKEIVLSNLKNVGQNFVNSKIEYQKAEFQCRIRAIRAINLGYDKKELAQAMGVATATITKWLKDAEK